MINSREIDIRRLLALNEDMYKAGYITKQVYEAMIALQNKKLTALGNGNIISCSKMPNDNRKGISA